MLYDPWDGDFVVVYPGETVGYRDFKTGQEAMLGRT
jgi:hypothetical protein